MEEKLSSDSSQFITGCTIDKVQKGTTIWLKPKKLPWGGFSKAKWLVLANQV